jgi:hypothetical protein
MDSFVLDDEKLNTEIRKFLKKVGITSQVEIEKATKEKLDNGELKGVETLAAQMILKIPALELEHVIESDIDLK